MSPEFSLVSSLSLLFCVMSKLFSTGCHMVAADALPQTVQIQGHYSTTMFLFVAIRPQPLVGGSWHIYTQSSNFLIYPISGTGNLYSRFMRILKFTAKNVTRIVFKTLLP
jgi:hypothetical protein